MNQKLIIIDAMPPQKASNAMKKDTIVVQEFKKWPFGAMAGIHTMLYFRRD